MTVTHKQTIKFYCHAGVYLSHNRSVLINDSNIAINIIQTSLDASHSHLIVVCTSDRMPCCKDQEYGEWHFPNGSQVKHKSEGAVAFHRIRDNFGNVHLLRTKSDIKSPIGKFCCEVEDATGRNQTLCINICNSTCVHITDGVATPTLGQSYSLTCSVAKAEMQTIHYKWIKDDVELVTTGTTLSIRNLSLSDSGLYTCTVTVGSAMYSSTMEVVLQCKLEYNMNL